MKQISLTDLVHANAIAAGVDPREAIYADIPLRTAYRHLGNYRCRLGDASTSSLAAAIAQAEGFNVPNSVPQRANNPGDLEAGNVGSGTITAAGGQQITIYPTLDAGWAALQFQINRIITGSSTAGYQPGMTIAQVADIWVSGQAGSGKGASWAQTVASALGTTPGDSFAAQAGAEGGSLILPAGLSSIDLSAINDTIEADTGITPPAWLPYALVGLGIYFLVDSLS